jgi:hypothetical protein
MQREHSLEEHSHNLGEYKKASENLGKWKGTYDVVRESRVPADKAKIAEAAKRLTWVKEKLDHAQSTYDEVIIRGKEIGNLELNEELRAEAYREQANYLRAKAEALVEQAAAIDVEIEALEETMRAEVSLLKGKDEFFLTNVLDEIEDPIGKNRVHYLFREIMATEFAQATARGDTISSLTDGQIESFWQKAADRYKAEPKVATPKIAVPGWTPWHKEKTQ